MSRTDLISDVLTLIRNANMVKKDKVDVPSSKLTKEILSILKKEGFITNFKVLEDETQDFIRIYLKYSKDRTKLPAITNLKRISKPGLRIYANYKKLPRVLGGIGVAVLSTSKGILTDKECRASKVGGEVLCYIW